MPRYRTRPIEIEAARFDGELVGEWDKKSKKVTPGTCPEWFPANLQCFAATHMARAVAADNGGTVTRCNDRLYIGSAALGAMEAAPGDWITCDSQGVLGICKPDVFGRKYELVK
ncbi:hypothetical protein [Phenylobacterium sp.]|uniref:hypothetical protein n=1 Tax=Phenylobacterium sp. TaxID=1871053 RepID=UPI002DF5C93E|nr:hypothetical protein [Phenylobacterium sp.]